MGYELKTAVGTSVFVMAFTAFTGAALIANKSKPETLNRVVGVVLIGVAIFAVKLL